MKHVEQYAYHWPIVLFVNSGAIALFYFYFATVKKINTRIIKSKWRWGDSGENGFF